MSTQQYPSIIKAFPHFLHGGDYNPDQWQSHPEIIEEDFRLMPLAGCNTFSIGIFAWTSLEPREGEYTFDWLDNVMDSLADRGFNAILATPSAAKPAWLAQSHPEVCRVNEDGSRGFYAYRYNHCWSSPKYRERIQLINQKLAERYKNHAALAAWHVSNEYSGACFCELCLAKFYKWLERKYQTLDKLNQAWWSGFWNHTYTSFDQINPRDNCVDGLALDWKRFNTWQLCDFMQHEAKPLRELTPNIPITTNMMAGFYDIDYWRVADCCDFISVDCYPTWDDPELYSKEASIYAMEHDMLRNMKGGKPFLVMESTPGNLNWKEHYRLKRPGVHQLEMLLAAGHGADGTLYFQWRKGRGGLEKFHGAVVDHVGHENTRNFREVANIGEIYKKLDGVIGTTIKADTAVIRDWDSIWALDVSGGPTGHGKKNIETIQSHYRALYNLNVPMDVIESTCDFSQYKLVIVPMLYMLKPEVAKRLKEFVANGGVVVSTYLSGYVNESNLCFTDGWPGDGLKEVFGIWNEELDGFAPTDTQTIRVVEKNELQLYGEFAAIEFAERIHLNQAKSLAVYCHDFYANEPAVTVNDFGKGKAYYIAVRSDEDFLYAFYEKLVKSEKITTSLPLGNPIGVHASVRTDGEKEFMFLYNFNKNKMQVDFGTATYFDLLENKKKSGIQMLSGHYSTVLEIC